MRYVFWYRYSNSTRVIISRILHCIWDALLIKVTSSGWNEIISLTNANLFSYSIYFIFIYLFIYLSIYLKSLCITLSDIDIQCNTFNSFQKLPLYMRCTLITVTSWGWNEVVSLTITSSRPVTEQRVVALRGEQKHTCLSTCVTLSFFF
jgi:hypothetical protein